jgi:hypothetical protein
MNLKSRKAHLTILICTYIGLSYHCVLGQDVAVINDPDGYVNIRQSPSLDSRVIGRIFNQDIFECAWLEGNSEWCRVSYGGQIPKSLKEMEPYKRNFYVNELHSTSDNIEIEGYVHSSRVIKIRSLPEIGVINLSANKRHLSIKNDSLVFEVLLSAFASSKHKIEKTPQGLRIDNLYPFGLASDLPRIEIENMTLQIREQRVEIPKSAYSNFFEFNLPSVKLFTDRKGVIYVVAFGSDGYTGYGVFWIFKDQKYLKTETETD